MNKAQFHWGLSFSVSPPAAGHHVVGFVLIYPFTHLRATSHERLLFAVVDKAGDFATEVFAMDNHINKTVFK